MIPEFLSHLGVEQCGDLWAATCRTPEERSRVAAAMADYNLIPDSKFDRESGTWTVFAKAP